MDEEGNQRFTVIDAREAIPVYDDTVEHKLAYGIRLIKADYLDIEGQTYIVEVYSKTTKTRYKSFAGFTSFTLLDEEPHFFDDIPLTFMDLNPDQDSIFDKVMNLNDAYNSLLSGEVDTFDAFADAYLVLKGVLADEEDLVDVKERRAFMIPEGADVSYLTKDINDTNIQNMLNNINEQIHKIALSPDFSDEKFMSASGISLRYKLIGFENKSSAIESEMRKALQRRIELIVGINQLKGDEVWRDINIVFTRNLPQNIEETATVVNQLRGLVSDRTLLSQIPFVKDIEAELKEVEKEKTANMDLYSSSFGNKLDQKEEEEVDEE